MRRRRFGSLRPFFRRRREDGAGGKGGVEGGIEHGIESGGDGEGGSEGGKVTPGGE